MNPATTQTRPMPDPENRWPDNVPGRYFVDRECIDCDLCRTSAPGNFSRSEDGYSFVSAQPQGAQEARDCEQARLDCPVAAIGLLDDALPAP